MDAPKVYVSHWSGEMQLLGFDDQFDVLVGSRADVEMEMERVDGCTHFVYDANNLVDSTSVMVAEHAAKSEDIACYVLNSRGVTLPETLQSFTPVSGVDELTDKINS